jgi:hypothetical protein
MDTIKHNTTSVDGHPDASRPSVKPGQRHAGQERCWPWSTSHFDWMDQYGPMPIGPDEGHAGRPILADTPQ